MIPMLENFRIQSNHIVIDGNEISVIRDDGNMIVPCDLKVTARQLQESIGMTVY